MSVWGEKNNSFMIFKIFLFQNLELYIQGIIHLLIIPLLSKLIVVFRLERFHPLRLMNWFSFFLFAVFVPFVYVRIFYWRWNHKSTGLNEKQKTFRKKQNVASMGFNMSIWALELTASIFMVSFYLRGDIYIASAPFST